MKQKQYIDKDALVAEIEDWRNKIERGIFSIPLEGRDRADATFEYEILGRIRDFIDTLEVKEVDLEKELNNFIERQKAFVKDDRVVEYDNGDTFNHIYDLEDIAKHFFELGLKAQKGE